MCNCMDHDVVRYIMIDYFTNSQTDSKPGKQRHRDTGGQIGRQTAKRQRDRETERQTNSHTKCDEIRY